MTLPVRSPFGGVVAEPILGVASHEKWPFQEEHLRVTSTFIDESTDDHIIEIAAVGYPGTSLLLDLNQYASTTATGWTNHSWGMALGAGSVCASGQVPIYMDVRRPKLESDEHFVPDMLISLKIPKKDDHGLVPPTMHVETVRRIPTQSLGDKIEPLARYIRESYEIIMKLRERRGSDSQEHFMFDSVAPFIEKYRFEALRELNCALPSLPSSAKYYYPYLLGHLDLYDERLSQTCIAFLNRYAESLDTDIKEGAIEALNHLNAA